MVDLMKMEGVPLQEHVFAPICSHLLKICYFIAIIDLIQALYFLLKSFVLLEDNINLYSIIAFLGSIFWIFMVGLLLVGLWKNRFPFIVGWLCFSIVGVILDVLFFMWTISTSDHISWREILQFTLLYLGIVTEWFCVYLVYKYCLRMKSSTAVNISEDGNIRGSERNQSSDLIAIGQPRKVQSRTSRKSTSFDHSEKTGLSKTKSIAETEKGKKKSQLGGTSDKTGRVSESKNAQEKDLSQSKDTDDRKQRKIGFDLVTKFTLCFNNCQNVCCSSMGNMSDEYLVICSYAIALVDFISAVLFASVSGMLYAQHQHWTSLAALIFSLLWMLIILLLLLGIFWRNLTYVRYWLVFTCLGIMLDAILLLYGLTLAIAIDWEGVKITVLPFVGLAVEMTFVYIIYIFYLDMINREQWIPVARNTGGYSQHKVSSASSGENTKRRERRRLKKFYKREEKAALRELGRKLRRGQV